MLNRLAPTAHGLGILIQPLLHGFDDVLMLPSRDPAFFARSTLLLDGAGAASVGHVTTQLLSVFHGGEGVLQPLSGRAAIDVLVRQIDEVLLAKAAFQFSARRHRLWQRHIDAGLL